jgi:hypothetical protein
MSVIDELQKNVDSVLMGMDPLQPADQLELIRNLERSARAELKLRVWALRYAQGLGSKH